MSESKELKLDCPCKRKCERHGDCDACRAHHANKHPVACERGKKVK